METFLKQSKAPRIKEERKRLGFTQAEMAEKCGVKRLQWVRYEKGEQDLSGDVLAAFGKQGADVIYILTGNSSDNLKEVGQIANYRIDGVAQNIEPIKTNLMLNEPSFLEAWHSLSNEDKDKVVWLVKSLAAKNN